MLVAGGVSPRQLANGNTPNQYPDQITANTTFLQTGAGGFARVSTALMALNQSQNVFTLSTAVGTLEADITALQGQVATLQGQVTTLQGQVSTLQAQVAAQQITINSMNWVQVEVSTGLTFLDQRTIYTRSFVISGALATALNVYTYAHGVPNINYVAQAIGVAGINAGTTYPISYLTANSAPSIQDAISMIVDTTNIYILNGSTIRTNYLVLIKLYYTATDR